MKKIFAIFVFVILALALSSCSLLSATYEEDLEYKSDKSDTGVYYSALNIEVVSYYYEEEDRTGIRYELQIGLRNLYGEPLLTEGMAYSLADELSNKLRFGFFDYIGSFAVYDYYLSNSESEYTYYCFSMIPSAGTTLMGDDAHYGFFYYGREYTLTVPTWINSLRSDGYTIISHWISNGFQSFDEVFDQPVLPPLTKKLADTLDSYTIDPDAVRLRYYFGGVNVEAKDAIWVNKIILSLDSTNYGTLNCLMWQAGETYDFTSFKLSIEKMAPGWYIIPILLGTLVVVILFLVCKNKKVEGNVFRQVTAENVTDTDNAVKIIDGQISMEEYSSIEECQDVQTTSTENDNG